MTSEKQEAFPAGDNAALAAVDSAPRATGSTEESPEAPHGPRAPGTSITVLIGLILAIATGSFALYRTYTAPPAAPAVYTVNLDALVQAKAIQSESITDVKAYSTAMQAFMKDLRSTFDGLSGRGVIVLKSDAVLTNVASVDITGRMAEKLGLTEALAEVPAHQAQRRAQYEAQIKGSSGPHGTSDAGAAAPASAASGAGAAGASGASDANPLSKLD